MLNNSDVLDGLLPFQINQFKIFSRRLIKLKRFIGFAALLALISAPAFAASGSEKFTLVSPVTVGTTKLPATDYKVTWNATGADAQVTLTHGKSVVTLPAKVVEQKHDVTS